MTPVGDFRPGSVALVGAGPGDPELLTRRAAARLAAADVVFYDALVDTDVLALAGKAQRIYVGKRAGRPAIRQTLINQLLVRAARRGQRVVRLKGGAPFVFGRGGEEGLALGAANVPFEVVPGITSAVAAPALAGLPVTHRGISSGFAVVAGHARASYQPTVDAIVPGSLTLVFMMAVAEQQRIADALVARGWRSSTPAALIFSASRDDAATWTGTLATLSRGDGIFDAERPGMLVVGDVVSLRARLNIDQDADAREAAANEGQP